MNATRNGSENGVRNANMIPCTFHLQEVDYHDEVPSCQGDNEFADV